MYVQDLDEIISDFLRSCTLTMVYEGPHHGYSIISREEMVFCCMHCTESYKRETSRKSADKEQ